MATKRQLAKAIESFGGSWDVAYDTIDAPAGSVWAGTGGHEFVMARDYNEMKFSSSDYQTALDIVQDGIEPCRVENCERCSE